MSCQPSVPPSGMAVRVAAVLAGAVLALGLLPGTATALSAGELLTDPEELLAGAEEPAPTVGDLLLGEDAGGSPSELPPDGPLEQLPAALERTTDAVGQAVEALPLPEDPALLDVARPTSPLRLGGTADAAPVPVPAASAPHREAVAPVEGPASASTTLPEQPPAAEGGPPRPTPAEPAPVAAASGVGVQAAGLEPLGVLAADAARQFGVPLLVMVAVVVFLAAGGQLAPHDRKALARASDDAGRGFR